MCTLDPVTRRAAASDFFGEDYVPTHAVTAGLETILNADQILCLALGEHKAGVVFDAFEGGITDRVPASYLQEHPNVTVLLDQPAAGGLTGIATTLVAGQYVLGRSDDQESRSVALRSHRQGAAEIERR